MSAVLEAVAVRKAFGGLVAVDDMGFAIAAGEIVGLIGPNGSGKTTMLNQGATIIMVEHVMDAIRSLCSRWIVMNAGRKIAEGPSATVLADAGVIRAYLGEAHA